MELAVWLIETFKSGMESGLGPTPSASGDQFSWREPPWAQAEELGRRNTGVTWYSQPGGTCCWRRARGGPAGGAVKGVCRLGWQGEDRRVYRGPWRVMTCFSNELLFLSSSFPQLCTMALVTATMESRAGRRGAFWGMLQKTWEWACGGVEVVGVGSEFRLLFHVWPEQFPWGLWFHILACEIWGTDLPLEQE